MDGGGRGRSRSMSLCLRRRRRRWRRWWKGKGNFHRSPIWRWCSSLILFYWISLGKTFRWKYVHLSPFVLRLLSSTDDPNSPQHYQPAKWYETLLGDQCLGKGQFVNTPRLDTQFTGEWITGLTDFTLLDWQQQQQRQRQQDLDWISSIIMMMFLALTNL